VALVAQSPGMPIDRSQVLATRSRRKVGSLGGMSRTSLLTP
jgi:hypothetical protein